MLTASHEDNLSAEGGNLELLWGVEGAEHLDVVTDVPEVCVTAATVVQVRASYGGLYAEVSQKPALFKIYKSK